MKNEPTVWDRNQRGKETISEMRVEETAEHNLKDVYSFNK